MSWESSSMQVRSDAPEAYENSRQAEAILAGVTRLPTLPAVATRLLSMGVSEDVHLDEMIELIEADPALSARMLSLCRCADAGLGDRITTVRRAVIMLGLEAVRSAVLSVLVFDRLRVDRDEHAADSLLDIEGFWTRSIATACVSERIAVARSKSGIGSVESDQAYLAGLVAGLGKMSLYKVLPKSWEKALLMADVQHLPLSVAERATIGIDHHTAGKRLAEHWGLPESIRDVIWLHGQLPAGLPEHCNRELVSVVTLAGAWCEDRHIGWSGEVRAPVDLDEIAEEIGFDLTVLDSVSAEIIEQVSDRAKILGVGEFSAPELLLESLVRANSKLAAMNDELRAKQQIADRSHKLLEAADTFYESIGDGVEPERVVEAMIRSGSTLSGMDVGMVIVQEEPGYPWLKYKVVNGSLVEVSDDERSGGDRFAQRVESPPLSDAGEIRPGHIAGLSGDQVLDLASLGWFREMISSVREIGVASLIGVGDSGIVDADDGLGDGSAGGVSCLVVLVKASSSAAPELSAKGFRVISRAWGRSMTDAVRAKAARALSEELANTNRELSSMQRERMKNESLLRLGQMAAGAAHEMNNPLSVIHGRAQQLFERLGGQRDRESVQAIASAADSLSSMITSMHLLAEPPVPALSGADPVLVVRQAIELAKGQCKNAGIRAKVKLSTSGEIDPINVDRDLMAKAICEPILNSIYANPVGVVSVSIEPAGSDGRVMVRIVDTGPGLSKRAQNHAFDPFFSELNAGRRPGLGLSRARSVIELHGGTITIGNTAGRVPGAQVQITLQTFVKGRRRAA
ncbi:MAG: HDOD domain-containing protein [Phycisphaerales bacterium]|nr:HDOD domain-containing protein [Phycisphaerales bacterium]